MLVLSLFLYFQQLLSKRTLHLLMLFICKALAKDFKRFFMRHSGFLYKGLKYLKVVATLKVNHMNIENIFNNLR